MLGVVLLSQAVGLVFALGGAVGRGEPMPSAVDLRWAALAGLAAGAGIILLYRGLAVGRMGVVAPVTGLLAAGVPVGAGILIDGPPSPGVAAGIAVAVVAVILVGLSRDGAAGRSGIEHGLAAGLLLGIFNVLISRVADDVLFGPLVIVRAVEAVLIGAVIVASGSSWRLPRAVAGIGLVVGLLDMAGNAFFLAAAQAGRLDVAAVLSSLYPVTTVILAAVVLRERIARAHAVGIVAALAAILLISSG